LKLVTYSYRSRPHAGVLDAHGGVIDREAGWFERARRAGDVPCPAALPSESLAFLSTGCTLEPGDVIFTGTPSGIGAARRPAEWPRDGDIVRVEIGGPGTLVNPVARTEVPAGAV
jgi:hypothetical protein